MEQNRIHARNLKVMCFEGASYRIPTKNETPSRISHVFERNTPVEFGRIFSRQNVQKSKSCMAMH